MSEVYGNAWPHLPVELLAWLATTQLRLWVYGVRSVYGVLRFAHLLGMAGFLGMLLLIEVKRLGFFPSASIQSARLPVVTLMNVAFGLTVIAGLALFIDDPIGAGLHTMFLAKLGLIVVGLVHAYRVERASLMRHQIIRRISAGFALTVWVLVIAASTWNAVERPLNPADVYRADPRPK